VSFYTYTKFLLRQKNFGKAEEMLEKSLGLDPENKEYLQLMAALLMRRGRNKEAVVIIS
jgi:Flp pilus assembly protein TadD